MCMSKIKGGRRCYAHANQAFDKALDKYEAAQAAASADPFTDKAPAAMAAEKKAHIAGVQLAASSRGRVRLTALAEQAVADKRLDLAGWYDSMIREGQVLEGSHSAIQDAYARDPYMQRNVQHEAGLKAISELDYGLASVATPPVLAGARAVTVSGLDAANRRDAVAADEPDASALGGPTTWEQMQALRDPADDYDDDDFSEREDVIADRAYMAAQRPEDVEPDMLERQEEARRKNLLTAAPDPCGYCGKFTRLFSSRSGIKAIEHSDNDNRRCLGSW